MVNWTTNQTIQTLIDEIDELTKTMDNEEKNNWWDVNGSNLPVAVKYDKIVSHNASYPIWACNDDGDCLVGDRADEIEHIEDI